MLISRPSPAGGGRPPLGRESPNPPYAGAPGDRLIRCAVGARRGARVGRDDLPLADPGADPRRESCRRRLGDRDCRPRSGLRTAGGRQRGTPRPRRGARDHLGLAPRPLPPPRPRARQGGGWPLPGSACEVGLAGRPELLPLLPAPGAVRRLLLTAVPAELSRSPTRTR